MFVIMGATFVFVYCCVLICLVTPATFLLHIDWECKRPWSLLVSSAKKKHPFPNFPLWLGYWTHGALSTKAWSSEMSSYRNIRDEKQQHLGNKGELRQRMKGFWFPAVMDWLEIAVLALTDPCIKWHDEKQLQGIVFVIAYVWKHGFSVSLCLVCDHRSLFFLYV